MKIEDVFIIGDELDEDLQRMLIDPPLDPRDIDSLDLKVQRIIRQDDELLNNIVSGLRRVRGENSKFFSALIRIAVIYSAHEQFQEDLRAALVRETWLRVVAAGHQRKLKLTFPPEGAP